MNRKRFRIACVLLALCLLLPLCVSPVLADVSVTASAAIVMDYDTGEILYAKDIDTMRVPASMTKIMTAYIIYEELAKGNLTKDTMVPVSATAASMSRDGVNYPASVPLTAGSSHSVDTFLKLIMIPSASASCYAMAEYISGSEATFVQRMNDTAKRLGMDADYKNSHGAKPHYQTARSVAQLIRAFIQTYPDILNYTSMKSVTFNGVTYSNTNRLLSDYYYQGADGFKTGTIAESGYCLSTTAQRDGRRMIAVVMNSSSTANRHLDSQKLLNYGFEEAARRDAARNSLVLGLSSAPDQVRRNADFKVAVQLYNIHSTFTVLGGGWTVNGQTVSTFDSFTPTNYQTVSYTHCVTDPNAQSVEIGYYVNLPGGQSKTWSVTLPVSSQEPALYRDIHGIWSEQQIVKATGLGLFAGDERGYFNPEAPMNRAMFVTVLGRLAEYLDIDTTNGGTTPFIDAQQGLWYSGYLAWAWEQKIVTGESETWFGVNSPVTRQEAATMLYRFMQLYGIELEGEGQSSFTDGGDISPWAVEAVAEAVRTGLILGHSDGTFRPADTASREQVAVIFVRFVDALGDGEQEYTPEESERDDITDEGEDTLEDIPQDVEQDSEPDEPDEEETDEQMN